VILRQGILTPVLQHQSKLETGCTILLIIVVLDDQPIIRIVTGGQNPIASTDSCCPSINKQNQPIKHLFVIKDAYK